MNRAMPFRAWDIAARNSVISLWLWAIVFVFACIAAAPVYFIARHDFGWSLAASSVGRLGYLWFGDVAFKYLGLAPAAAGWMAVPLGVFLLLSIFLSGGVFGRLAAGGENVKFGDFAADCGRFFGRFLRTFLLSIPVYVVVFAGLFKLFATAFKTWIERAGGEATVIIASSLELIIALLLLSIVQMTFDFVRVQIVSRNEKSVLTAAAAVSAYLGKRSFAAWGYYLAGAAFGVAAGALFLAVTNILPGKGPAGFLPGFLLSQAFVWSRIWIKIFVNAMEIQLYERPLAP